MKIIATIVIVAAAFAGFIWATGYGLDKQARIDCLKWQAEAPQYDQYFITHWQKDQCDSFGITINAPVHD